VEALSVIIQVLVYKRTGRRVFLMAPDPPPLREEGLGRAADRDPLLDHLADPGDDRPRHAQGALNGAGPSPGPGREGWDRSMPATPVSTGVEQTPDARPRLGWLHDPSHEVEGFGGRGRLVGSRIPGLARGSLAVDGASSTTCSWTRARGRGAQR
jgi:hypothetical protein